MSLFLKQNKARLLHSFEVARMIRDGYDFNQWNICGEFWTSTRVSCSTVLVYRLPELTTDRWDKTFSAWVVALPK